MKKLLSILLLLVLFMSCTKTVTEVVYTEWYDLQIVEATTTTTNTEYILRENTAGYIFTNFQASLDNLSVSLTDVVWIGSENNYNYYLFIWSQSTAQIKNFQGK